MGGLFHAARAAQAVAGSQTIMGGNVSEPPAGTAYEDEPTPEPVKTAAYAEKPAPTSSVPDDTLALAPIDEAETARDNQGSSAPRQEDYRLTKAAAVVPGGETPANYRKQRAVVPETRYAQLTDKKDEIFKPERPVAFDLAQFQFFSGEKTIVVRAIMEKYYGPIEWGRTPQTDQMIVESRSFDKRIIAAIESAAEERYQETFKVDSSKTGPR